jgi:hypothetical protein
LSPLRKRAAAPTSLLTRLQDCCCSTSSLSSPTAQDWLGIAACRQQQLHHDIFTRAQQDPGKKSRHNT